MRKRANRRRGALLLVVLSILVLFLIIAVTFVVVARNFRDGAESAKRRELTGIDPAKTCDKGLEFVLVGPQPDLEHAASFDDAIWTRKPEKFESLLGDLRGWHWVRGYVFDQVTNTPLSGQLVEIRVAPEQENQLSYTFNEDPGFYNGGVLTVLSGRGRGISSRIVNYFYDETSQPPTGRFIVEALKYDGYEPILPLPNDKILINGRPFSGYTSTDTRVPSQEGTITVDEDYDAFDKGNYFLSKSRTVAEKHATTGEWKPTGKIETELTSYRVPAVVDNDGDNVKDSGWIDPGFGFKCLQSPQSGVPKAQRTYYRERIAVLCRDLDSRINLNVHGNNAQTASGGYDANVPNGRGFGPADVNPYYLYLECKNDPVTAEDQYFQLFEGESHVHADGSTVVHPGRYGDDKLPGQANRDDVLSQMKNLGIYYDSATGVGKMPGYVSPPDLWGDGRLTSLDADGHPTWSSFMFNDGHSRDDPYEFYPYSDGFRTHYDYPFTPAEMVALLCYYDSDRRLLPERLLHLAEYMVDDQYHQDLVPNGAGPVPGDVPINRRRVTTRSSHIPVIDAPVTSDQWRADHTNFLTAHATTAGVTVANMQDTTNKDLRHLLLPFEVIRSLKMDLNRPFGDGIDNDDDGTTDEDGELDTGDERPNAWPQYIRNELNLDGQNDEMPPFYHWDGSESDADRNTTLFAKQLYARHLYCLMLSLMDPARDEPSGKSRAGVHRRIAQWAINVVDFRDPDAIMTPFPYDTNPFDYDPTDPTKGGWEVDPTDPDKVVWGCEYPHLVLSEIAAFHDRKVTDETVDDSGIPDHGRLKGTGTGTTGTGTTSVQPGVNQASGTTYYKFKEEDATLDQLKQPEGSLFIEVQCTGHPSSTSLPLPDELYSSNKIHLSRMAKKADGTDSDWPVWRIAITEARKRKATDPTTSDKKSYREYLDIDRTDTDRDADMDKTDFHPPYQPAASTNDPRSIERIIWFSTAKPTGSSKPGYVFGASKTLAPDQYLVVGSRNITDVGANKIDLSAVDKVLATASSGNIALSASEPTPDNHYPATGGGGSYTTAYDEPLDTEIASGRTNLGKEIGWELDVNGDKHTLLFSGTYLDYKTALLQRLANPLQEHHATNNPYITVDWMPIDLTVFNSEAPKSNYAVTGSATMTFHEVQAGTNIPGAPPTGDLEIIETPTLGNVDPLLVPYDKQDPWGPFGENKNGATTPPKSMWDLPVADENKVKDCYDEMVPRRSRERGRNDRTHDKGNLWTSRAKKTVDIAQLVKPASSPNKYFPRTWKDSLGTSNNWESGDRPWFIWNDRPFASAMELMLVPWSSPGRLLYEFNLGSENESQFTGTQSTGGKDWLERPFAHLPHFYADGVGDGDYFRIFDFVDVPSRFVGAELQCQPIKNTSLGWNLDVGNNSYVSFNDSNQTIAGFFRPPFNTLSRFREPGRVNINTISDWYNIEVGGAWEGDYSAIWQALTRLPREESAYMWDRIRASRDSSGPFRGFHKLGNDSLLRTESSDKLIRTNNPNPNEGESAEDQKDRVLHPFHEVDGIQRIYNMLTTRSNVYAIWVTVGYFEWDPNLGKYRMNAAGEPIELGEETGDITRHRAFYIVDRSIPVGFEPGERHNIDRAVLVKRFIE